MLIRIENCGECPALEIDIQGAPICSIMESAECFSTISLNGKTDFIAEWCPLREREVSRSMEKRVNVQREDTVPLTKQIRGEDGEWLTTWTGGGEGNPCSTCGGNEKVPAGETLTAGYNPCPQCKPKEE